MLSPSSVEPAPLLGRSRLLDRVTRLARSGRNVLLIGEAGVGKTALLTEARERLRERRTWLYAAAPRTLRNALVELTLQMARIEHRMDFVGGISERELCSWTVPRLKRLLADRVLKGGVGLIFDPLTVVRHPLFALLEWLIEKDARMIAACRSLRLDEIKQFWRLTWAFEKVPIPPLTPGWSAELIRRELEPCNFAATTINPFIRDVVRWSDGNPGLIVNACRLARDPRYRIGGHIHLNLIQIDLRMQMGGPLPGTRVGGDG